MITVGTDSFISLADANSYFGDRLYSEAWENADQTNQEKALKMATRRICSLKLSGYKTDTDQLLAFPRNGVAEIPQDVKDATCEEALALLDHGDSQRTRLQAQGVKSASFGKTSETYAGITNDLLSPDARRLLRSWIYGSLEVR